MKRIITESQLIHLNDIAQSIAEVKEDINSVEDLKQIIGKSRRGAIEIKRMLKYINSEEEIHERRVWSEEKNPVRDLLENIDDMIELNEGD